jgi:hypothetical protein
MPSTRRRRRSFLSMSLIPVQFSARRATSGDRCERGSIFARRYPRTNEKHFRPQRPGVVASRSELHFLHQHLRMVLCSFFAEGDLCGALRELLTSLSQTHADARPPAQITPSRPLEKLQTSRIPMPNCLSASRAMLRHAVGVLRVIDSPCLFCSVSQSDASKLDFFQSGPNILASLNTINHLRYAVTCLSSDAQLCEGDWSHPWVPHGVAWARLWELL